MYLFTRPKQLRLFTSSRKNTAETRQTQSGGAATKAEDRQKPEIRNPKSETNSNFVNFFEWEKQGTRTSRGNAPETIKKFIAACERFGLLQCRAAEPQPRGRIDKIMGAAGNGGRGTLTADYADFRGWGRGINIADPPSRGLRRAGDAKNAEKTQGEPEGNRCLTANLR
jgi:hypothetical protein